MVTARGGGDGVDRRTLLKSGAVAVGAATSGCGDRLDPEPETGSPSDDGTESGTPTGTDSPTAEPGQSEPVTVAFIGDQGLKDSSRDVLRLIQAEGADLVVHSGDFDYENDPAAWGAMLEEELGPAFPYVASIGNHDFPEWEGYREVLRERADGAEGLTYTGDIGLQATYSFRGVTVVVVSPGVCDPEDAEEYPDPCRKILAYDHERYVTDELARTDATWRVCSWHMVNRNFQIGDKGTDVPLSTYDAAREGGAIIATGHNHAYARTHLMSDFTAETVASTSPPYTIGDGTTFSLVSALGGQSFYPTTDMADDDCWARTYSGEGGENAFGAFFCTFRPDGTGEAYFKNADGAVVDGPVRIRSAVGSGASRPVAGASEPEGHAD